ncbi:hypothetical protein [Lyngbya sp. CCY1209]|uniref:hypothetical protein n=1 Tax=Lyngbya sp. CCY1209 TaxID=2886103 RepID=UPI002D214749|nr:hypothetical protein [Lyngbya sp. CCY1209]MEB3884052.1 hypothetical protein [Lyngbya sp. CCY1209]
MQSLDSFQHIATATAMVRFDRDRTSPNAGNVASKMRRDRHFVLGEKVSANGKDAGGRGFICRGKGRLTPSASRKIYLEQKEAK